MNKKGQALGVVAVILLGILVLGVIGGGVWYFSQNGSTQSVAQSASVEKEVTGNCETVPYITVTARDKINLGTAVTSLTLDYAVNGEYKGTLTSGSSGTTFQYGDIVDILVAKADYLNTVVEGVEIKCGDNPVIVDLYATDDGTLKVYDEDGTAVTDSSAGGAANQSSSATTIQQEVKITSKSDQSLGDLVIIVEAQNTSQVDDITMSDGDHTTVSSINVPDFHTVESTSTGSIVKAFFINANDYLKDGKADTYTLSIEPESGETIDNNAMYLTVYTQEYFKDVDGSFVYAIEDSEGTNKYEDDFDYDWNIGGID